MNVRISLTLVILAVAALLSGCSSYHVCTKGDHTMCYVQNSGWKLFCCIPLASGDPENPNENTCLPFYDSVTLKSNMTLVKKAMQSEGATGVKDLSSYKTEEQVFFILLKRYVYHTSAELLK